MRETIEKAAREFDKSKCKHFRREHTKEAVYDSFEEGFTAGAKSDAARDYWFEKFQEQDKNKYSEEEVLNILHNYRNHFELHRNLEVLPNMFFKWFEQFKKTNNGK
jgi:hypothetical protein